MSLGVWWDRGPISPQASVSADAALLRRRELGLIPDSLVFYSRDRPAISLGHFSSDDELEMGLVVEKGLEVVRRVSGGRPIYSDPGQINYALALESGLFPEDPTKVFSVVCRGLIASLHAIGVEAMHHAPNDLEVHGRKISGSALKRGHGATLVHGTILVSTDLDMMARLFRSKGGRSQRPRNELTDLRSEMRNAPARADLINALVDGLGQALDVVFVPDRSFLQVEQR
ncbi:MAG: lipoate--protein ligase family protein [Methanomassiliicoccales archaeon]